MKRRSIACALALVGLSSTFVGAEPALADPPEVITAWFTPSEAHPGDTVEMTITFTNPEEVDVIFAYLGLAETYDSIFDNVDADYVGCTGDADPCFMHPNAPIAPSDSRTVTLTWSIDSASPCGPNIDLAYYVYAYRESSAGNIGGIAGGANLDVTC